MSLWIDVVNEFVIVNWCCKLNQWFLKLFCLIWLRFVNEFVKKNCLILLIIEFLNWNNGLWIDVDCCVWFAENWVCEWNVNGFDYKIVLCFWTVNKKPEYSFRSRLALPYYSQALPLQCQPLLDTILRHMQLLLNQKDLQIDKHGEANHLSETFWSN